MNLLIILDFWLVQISQLFSFSFSWTQLVWSLNIANFTIFSFSFSWTQLMWIDCWTNLQIISIVANFTIFLLQIFVNTIDVLCWLTYFVLFRCFYIFTVDLKSKTLKQNLFHFLMNPSSYYCSSFLLQEQFSQFKVSLFHELLKCEFWLF